MIDHSWSPELIQLTDDCGDELLPGDCPVRYAIQSGAQSLRRLTIHGRSGRLVQVDMHAVPVVDKDGVTHGATVVLHDASPEASLEKRCQSLHDRATKDPLTQVANRAEFDRALEIFVKEHLERCLPCSLVICDIDHFKRINDTYGHPAGDEALKSFAQMLKGFCQPGDLAARYGGEEFVLLCADCNNSTAADRAEEIRRAVSQLPQPALRGQCITASFGVTEVQHGDTPATMLRRADRALLEAKQRGRNMVVQLGGGIVAADEPAQRRGWFGRGGNELLVEKWMSTMVPMQVAIEKLRGFVMDHFAEIESIDGETIHSAYRRPAAAAPAPQRRPRGAVSRRNSTHGGRSRRLGRRHTAQTPCAHPDLRGDSPEAPSRPASGRFDRAGAARDGEHQELLDGHRGNAAGQTQARRRPAPRSSCPAFSSGAVSRAARLGAAAARVAQLRKPSWHWLHDLSILPLAARAAS